MRIEARWRALALLFAVRAAMAFQFQTVGALSPLFAERYGVGLAEIGVLIGLYVAPGIVFAAPGGALAGRFGDRRIVLLALGLMAAGGALALVAPTWELALAARLIAGTGGVIVNVVLSKMAADWFAGREIATAMAVFVNSWPVGIAAALSVLPLVAGAGGLGAALGLSLGFVVLGFALILLRHRPAPRAPGAAAPAAFPRGRALAVTLMAASIWGLYNGGFSMVFSFGPALLAERGFALAAASGATSLSIWALCVAAPLSGLVADRTGRRDLMTALGLLLFALGLLAARAGAPPALAFALIGLAAGIPAGTVMAMPAAALRPETRAAGMGLFYTIFYALSLAAPAIGGAAAEAAGTAAASFDAGALMVAACFPLLLAARLTLRAKGGPSAPAA